MFWFSPLAGSAREVSFEFSPRRFSFKSGQQRIVRSGWTKSKARPEHHVAAQHHDTVTQRGASSTDGRR
jgi:hypothetical protein